MSEDIVLAPQPRRVERLGGNCAADVPVKHQIDAALAEQGYRLEVSPAQIIISSSTEQGRFYGEQTLAQLRRQFSQSIPALRIEDWPDFAVRGVMLDVSRDKVPTMQTLLGLVDLLAHLKINQLQLYTEHTFAYRGHEAVWEKASPMTGEEIRELDRYCRERFIELVPNQNSFGHMERWLRHRAYEPLAECPDGFTFPWGVRHKKGFSLNPLDPRSLELIEDLFEQLLPNFTSGSINVGCDETFDLGLGKSKQECERRGKHRVYLAFLLKIYELTQKHGKTMQFWGDIILHEPALIAELPKDVVALNWGYEADHPFEKETAAFAQAGVPFYVAPGTSSWCSCTGRFDNAVANLKRAAACGLENGARGYLNTDWGDIGHLQYLPIAYPGLVAGAAYSWCLKSNERIDLAEAMSRHVFHDAAGVLATALLELGNVYQHAHLVPNGSSVFWSLVGNEERKKLYGPLTEEHFARTEQAIAEALAPLDRARADARDVSLIKDELRNNAEMLRAGCMRGRLRLRGQNEPSPELRGTLTRIMEEHRRLWLARNRDGGLSDSLARLEYPLNARP
ncbi:MAG TPA: family 20 glycosylhydrolase [Tepidisphaeraceae bacterium]|jgi:hypothetical protein